MPTAPLTQRRQELSKYFGAEAYGLANQFVSLPAYFRRIAASAVGLEILQVFGQGKPAVNQAFIEFEVALQAVSMVTVAKGLVRTSCGLRQVYGACRHVECVTVPLEHRVRLRK